MHFRLSSRPPRRDPYGADSRVSNEADAFFQHQRQGLWVPAFAGTTLMTSPKSPSRTAPSTVTANTIVSSLLTVPTSGPGFVDLTAEVARFAKDADAREGAVTLFIRHTSASLTIQENADPSVLDDLMTALDRLAPEDAGWTHDTEGPDDMPAHVKTMLTASSLHIPVLKREPALGTWQAVYLIEHRRRPHRREIVLQFIGARG
jgi:secondary thiamine-phosphate synthase enzyme